VSLFTLLFFSYAHLRDPLGPGRIAALGWLVTIAVLCGLLLTLRRPPRVGTRIANAVGAVLLAASAGPLLVSALAAPELPRYRVDPKGPAPSDAELPDIYLVVLDGYGRADVLRALYDHDNSTFLQGLRRRGFGIAEGSTANYGQTGLSVASMLNLAYLDELAREMGDDSRDHRPLADLIRNGALQEFLGRHGYTVVAFSSGYAVTELTSADVYVSVGAEAGAFRRALLDATPLPDLRGPTVPRSRVDAYRERVPALLQGLARAHQLAPSPKLVFAHLPLPHPPFVFGPAGEPVEPGPRFSDDDGDWLIRPGRMTRAGYRERYRDQLTYLNREVLAAVDEVLGRAERPAVVVLLGDHGPRSELFWEDPGRTNHWEALGILVALHLPGGSGEILYPGITPVNLFRALLDHLLGAGLGPLPDRSYFSTARRTYHFHDVTDRARRPGGA
jgi:hypothetical protein